MTIVDKIIRYESGEMTDDDMIDFFQELIDSGAIAHLQGSYQRTAVALVDAGLCTTPDQG